MMNISFYRGLLASLHMIDFDRHFPVWNMNCMISVYYRNPETLLLFDRGNAIAKTGGAKSCLLKKTYC